MLRLIWFQDTMENQNFVGLVMQLFLLAHFLTYVTVITLC